MVNHITQTTNFRLNMTDAAAVCIAADITIRVIDITDADEVEQQHRG